MQLTAELWNAPRHSLRSCPRRDLVRSAHILRFGLSVLAAVACARYELVPLTAKDCPPEPTSSRHSVVVESVPQDSVIGVVRTAGDVRPLQFARVELFVDGRSRGVVASDTSGRFAYSVGTGEHILRVRAPGFKPRNDTLPASSQTGWLVVLPMEVSPLDGCPGFQAYLVRKPWWKWW